MDKWTDARSSTGGDMVSKQDVVIPTGSTPQRKQTEQDTGHVGWVRVAVLSQEVRDTPAVRTLRSDPCAAPGGGGRAGQTSGCRKGSRGAGLAGAEALRLACAQRSPRAGAAAVGEEAGERRRGSRRARNELGSSG